MELPNIYKGNYKLLMIPPIIMILISLYFIPQIKMGVDFQGGTLITLALKEPISADTLSSELKSEGLDAKVQVYKTTVGDKAEIEVPQSQDLVKAEYLRNNFTALLPTVSDLEVRAYRDPNYTAQFNEENQKLNAIADQMFLLAKLDRSKMNITGSNDLEKYFSSAYSTVYKNYELSVSVPIDKYVKYDSISVQTVSPVLSSHFIGQAVNVVLFCAFLSVVLVFLFFRDIVPSIAVLTGSIADITIAMGGMGIFGIPFTLQSFAALLMLIGFSLDTDILLTTRLLKRRGNPRDNAYDAMKTGVTMSIMALVSFMALFVLAMLTHIDTYYEISAVALAGLVGDIVATWGINAVVVLNHKESMGDK